MKVHVRTFGCQMNKLDSELIEGALRARGFELAPDPDEADAVLFNTCSVRAHAENRVASHVGALARRAGREPELIVGVLGCMAERDADGLLRRFPHIRLLAGPNRAPEVPSFLEALAAGRERVVALNDGAGPVAVVRDADVRSEPYHAYVAAMRGCDNFCAYCIVPHVRGAEVSRPPGEIEQEARRLVDRGVLEITLLGQNVNSYGARLRPPVSLADLLERLDRIEGLLRIRFVTSHPRDMTEPILRAVADLPKVCEHLHMPAQSGSDRILAKMGRGYSRAGYLEKVGMAREIIPEVAIASDFIVGFPGETDRDARDTFELLGEVGFQQAFLFKYSPRPGTQAERWPDDVPDAVKRARLQDLIGEQRRLSEARHARLVGRTLEALLTGPSKSDPTRLAGRTRRNEIVICPADGARPGRITPVRITEATDLSLFGEPA
jgi:tRNA-2-methylthio-N6-dimethylallyladenosine synthase